MTTQDNFLPNEHSRMFKELGFDEPCIACYTNVPKDREILYFNPGTKTSRNSELGINAAAPTWLEAEDWLWQNHDIRIEVMDVSTHGEEGDSGIDEFESSVREKIGEYSAVIQKDSPISARMEAIKEAIAGLYSQLKNQ